MGTLTYPSNDQKGFDNDNEKKIVCFEKTKFLLRERRHRIKVKLKNRNVSREVF